MIGRQLDLFGGPPKPPKNIVIEEEPEVQEPAATAALTPQDDIAEEIVSAEVLAEQPVEEIISEALPEAELDTSFQAATVSDEGGVHIQMPSQDTFRPEWVTVEVSAEPENIAGFSSDPVGMGEPDSNEHAETPEWVTETLPDAEWYIPETTETAVTAEVEVSPVAVTPEPEPDASDAAEGGPLNIPPDQALYSRQYYTMRETANMFNVNQSLLRFWENEFDILKPRKNRKGDRYFRPDDIKNLELIYHLLRVRKFTISGAKDYLKNRAKSLDTFVMVQRLEKLKLFLQELKSHA